jgi:uncharacterized DUF497 family protein
MRLVWDEPKRLANLDKHGLDFADVTVDFFLESRIRIAKKGRLLAIGRLGDQTVAVVFTKLGSEAISLVSMRPANSHERR